MKNDKLSAKDWLEKAEEDIKVAEHLFKTSQFYTDVGFHCQQAAEKSLKAYLVYNREVPRKIHSLKDLLLDCLKYDTSLNEINPHLKILEGLYISTRYPFVINVSKEEAEEFLKSAKEVISRIKEKIK
jgi:HEPN domain-containing protein